VGIIRRIQELALKLNADVANGFFLEHVKQDGTAIFVGTRTNFVILEILTANSLIIKEGYLMIQKQSLMNHYQTLLFELPVQKIML
jgi:hypothetical protein